jgi:hypothetical protein
MSAPVTDPIEELLAAALADARTDDRWAIAPKAQALTAVRRSAARRRTATAGGALLVAAGATAGISLAVGHDPGQQTVIQQPADGGTQPHAVPGVEPEWTPTTGSEWVLDKPAYDDFVMTHILPSPAPHTVRSPAPLTEASGRLLRDVEQGLPADATTVRQDAPNGLAGAGAIHVRLADGTPVEVERMQLQEPISTQFGGDGPQKPMTRHDLPTGSVIVTIAGALYGWGPGIAGGANIALVVTPTGQYTYWAAPVSVPLTTVAGWAEAADRG